MHPINEFGTDAQKEKYLPRLGKALHRDGEQALMLYTAKGELVGCFVGCTWTLAYKVTISTGTD